MLPDSNLMILFLGLLIGGVAGVALAVAGGSWVPRPHDEELARLASDAHLQARMLAGESEASRRAGEPEELLRDVVDRQGDALDVLRTMSSRLRQAERDLWQAREAAASAPAPSADGEDLAAGAILQVMGLRDRVEPMLIRPEVDPGFLRWIDGELVALVSSLGGEVITDVGHVDPHRQEVVDTCPPDAGQPNGTIAASLRAGYCTKTRLLRAQQVVAYRAAS